MSAVPPHIAITYQPKSVYEPGERGVPSVRPSTTISPDTCKPMTQPLSPAAQAVLDAVEDDCIHPDDKHRIAAAALRAATDQVVPHEPQESKEFTNEAVRLNRMGTRSQFLTIANELEAHQ